MCEHTEYKYGERISHPRELIRIKSLYGDLGDNLPPGTPECYMDLCDPDTDFLIERTSIYPDLIRECNDPAPNVQIDHYLKAKEQLERKRAMPWGNFPG